MPTSPLHLLDPVVRDYAWGSRTFLAELRGRPTPSPGPEAELWFGAHPSAPATVLPAGTSLLDLIERDPIGTLGDAVADRFGGRLPFLVKLLAADQPLSLQAHPSQEQAEEGFAREETAGIDRAAPTRLYRDAWSKPELLHALTPVSALCGFREPGATIALLDELDVSALAGTRALLADGGEDAFPDLLELALHDHGWAEDDDAALAAAADRVAGGGGDFAAEARWLTRLLDRYPGDGGVRVALLLRLVDLAPGEALHLPGGNLHAYLEGAGVEVMASSDNVIRGGLTVKHVDVDELLRTVDARVLPPPVVAPERVGPITVLPAPTAFFRFERVDLDGAGEVALDRARGGPEVLVAVGSEVAVRAGDRAEVTVTPGGAAFVAAAAGADLTPRGRAGAHR
ncbi:MAG: mannose-6-phosphate isomerase, class I, partial [Nitriliruptor sp.]